MTHSHVWVRSGSDRSVWTVNRRWLPWRPRLKSKRAADRATDGVAAADLFDGFDIPILSGLVFLVSAVVLCALTALLIAEWFVVLALIPVLVVIRFVGVFPWIIVARRWSGTHVVAVYHGEVTGWRQAWRLLRTAKQEIREYGIPRALTQRAPSPGRART